VRSKTVNQGSGPLPEVRDRKAAKSHGPVPNRPFTVQQAAEQLCCSGDHIRNLISSGQLRAVRVPGLGRRAARVLVMQSDLDAAIRAWMVQA
jgi:excisionase family DNA binding protein